MATIDDRLARIEGALFKLDAGLARIERLQADYFRANQEMVDMASRNQEIINALKSELERNRNATESNRLLLTKVIGTVEENKDDPQELQAILDGLKANTDVLVAAAANTSGQPIPQQTVSVDQPKSEATPTTTSRG